ncbi:cobalt-precorrin-5B (C1)-methyltransferase [Bacteroides zoogleoformans]|uniref:Cobalt-precorrin-5B C(1)-methyltransferase n=1 Tax=Bacteroides zoogleoformans TaxID=28119 RepID=A0ABM6T5B3_9BACE|nr:cobalt-precorrin-5B (C(1))-methyltransferase CbiD [Bacteroides zoogleoformans]AVM51918.1 precorrin-6x reductase [Bacteroides zoogleoformans]TWJ17022.1 cobalt-precorrin-5B (C1)-methyltransferase [Bacteroides zoogleoformans]
MILIFGGTTEGRISVQTLEEAGKPFYYSTKGDEQEVFLHNGIRLQGAMDAGQAIAFCHRHDIRLIVDAAHPFATQLHHTLEQVSSETGIPVIRFERIFPERDEEHITWCRDYDDAIQRIEAENIATLLVLTGVQTIGKLKPLWQNNKCYFRILDRDSSRRLAREQGFPAERLFYYRQGGDERILLQQLRPEAILTKESGMSGGFDEKVAAARQLGIRIFALCRPDTSRRFICVNGEHGLRRMVEKLLPDFFPLHSGLTTGTCATAAAVAAAWDLFNSNSAERPEEFPVVLPNGETIYVPVQPQEDTPRPVLQDDGESYRGISATVIKDAGDDPDITDGMKIVAHVAAPSCMTDALREETAREAPRIIIRGGEGVGTVTLPGLGLEPGAPAINNTPREMIKQNVRLCLERLHLAEPSLPLVVTVSIPGGEEIARRTFNPRLGIEGGISVIGTSGIVKPFSSEAFVNSIRKSMEVAKATKSPLIVISSGAKSERHIKARYPDLPPQAFVHYGNFIGETLKIADEKEVARVVLGVMIGKAVKLAEGNPDTHSKKVTMNKAFIQDIARRAGCGSETLAAIGQMTLARELWDIIPKDVLKEFGRILVEHCHRYCAPLLPNGELTVLLINENGEIYS